jgi:polyphosphate glucokinase
MPPTKKPAKKKPAKKKRSLLSRVRGAKGVGGARPTTLAIDVGGSHVKASVLDERGRMLHDRVRVDTPKRLTPHKLVSLIGELVATLPRFDRVSVGFPGVVRGGVVRTAPNLGTERFHGFNLARAIEKRLGKPVRVENDADVQGLAVVKGKGVEMVITLGTGFGSSIFVDGRLGPHLELAHHPFRKDKTYEDELGEAARERDGNEPWQKHVFEAIESLRNLTNFDHLYIGGGNARLLDAKLPRDVSIVSNTAGIIGGVRLWA